MGLEHENEELTSPNTLIGLLLGTILSMSPAAGLDFCPASPTALSQGVEQVRQICVSQLIHTL